MNTTTATNEITTVIRPRISGMADCTPQSRARTLTPLTRCMEHSHRVTPKCMVVNSRSLVKPAAIQSLQGDLSSQHIDLCFISETWLHERFDANLICPNGFSLLSKNRINRIGGGVAIACRNDWKIKRIDIPSNDNNCECLWSEIRPTSTQVIYAGVVYHPPDPVYNPDELIEYLFDGLETLLTNNPGCRVILAGDINQLKLNTLMHQFSLSQLVKKPTRGSNKLDVFLTNTPFEFGTVKCVDSLINTDHKSVIVNPRTRAKATRKWVELRDTRAHCKLAMFDFLKGIDWLGELSGKNIDSAVSHFYSLINPAIDIFFDHVNHAILFDKLSQLPINPYIYNWIRDFLTGRQQRIAICGNKTRFLPINRGVPQGTIVGPVLFSIMINDIRSMNNSRTLLVKYADDITLSTYRPSITIVLLRRLIPSRNGLQKTKCPLI